MRDLPSRMERRNCGYSIHFRRPGESERGIGGLGMTDEVIV